MTHEQQIKKVEKNLTDADEAIFTIRSANVDGDALSAESICEALLALHEAIVQLRNIVVDHLSAERVEQR